MKILFPNVLKNKSLGNRIRREVMERDFEA